MTRAAWLVMLCVVLGCDVPQEDFSRRYAVAMCEREVRCGERAAQARCGAQLAHPEAERALLQVREGLATYSMEAAKTCLQALVDAPCGALPISSVSCVRTVSGTLGEDAGCLLGDAWSAGCEPGLICVANVMNIGKCPRCTRVGREGERPPCDYGYGVDSFLDSRTSTCVPLPGHGEKCRVAPVTEGQPTQLQCGPALRCSDAGRCEWAVSQSAFVCDGGVCGLDPLRPPLKPDGAECHGNFDCALNRCRDDVCTGELAECR